MKKKNGSFIIETVISELYQVYAYENHEIILYSTLSSYQFYSMTSSFPSSIPISIPPLIPPSLSLALTLPVPLLLLTISI